MTGDYAAWRGTARAMAGAVDAAVVAARTGDPVAFGEATAALATLDREQLAVLLGTVTRQLLETSHPDGLGSDDAQHVLSSTAKRAAGWYEPLDGGALVEALIGALGVTDPDGQPHPDRDAVLAHGILLIADQLSVLGHQLPPVLNYALGELHRSQTMEMP